MLKSLPLLIGLALLSACQTSVVTHGIPNLRQVSPTLWRGGQPNDEGWVYLHTLGVSNVVKLNPDAEGSDAAAERLGMTVFRCPITTAQQLGAAQLWEATIEAGATYAMRPGKTFVHCTHGQDRTGLIIATYRVLHDKWTKDEAEKEMLEHGFHKELIGLWDYWEDYKP